MNKNLLAIAVGAALVSAPMFASAAIKVYGHAQVEVGTKDNGATSKTEVTDNSRGRIGFSASEKLGNGLTAIAKYEFKTDTADNDTSKKNDGGVSLSGRESMVGLKGSFGTVQLGNLKGAYKYYGGVKYDAFVATLLEARGNAGMSKAELGNAAFGHNSFLGNSIGYMTPKMGGFSAWATYSPDEKDVSTGKSQVKNGDDGDYSFGVKYKQKAFEVFVAAINNNDADTGATQGDGIKFGGMYKFGNFKIMGQYEQLDVQNFKGGGSNGDDIVAGNEFDVDVDVYFLAGHAKFGNNVIVAQFGNSDYSYDGDSADADYWTIGLIHNMSKKTRLTAGFSSHEVIGVTLDGEGSSAEIDDITSTDTDIFSVGLRMIF